MLQIQLVSDYSKFEEIFQEVLSKHVPSKKKILRANDKPFMTKALRKAIKKRSTLENKYYNDRLPETGKVYKNREVILVNSRE